LAPVEVVAQSPYVIAAPFNGVVKEVWVQPNQSVMQNERLVSLDDVDLKNQFEIANKALQVAESQLRTAQQTGFVDHRQRSRIAELEAEVALKQSELDYARLRYERTLLTAPFAGVAVVNDPAQWRGKPVAMGERILSVADPSQVRLRIMLPVRDALVLQTGSEVNVFFDSDPLYAWQGALLHAVYEPELTPEGVMAYRVTADLFVPQDRSTPRIGLRGTAKVYGEQVSLFYYLFRRPMTTLRQWLGW
jgi:multidrug efflux pump subunit AcrA (membrane-fusion protein)